MKRILVAAYLVMLHALLAVVLLKTDFLPRAAERLGIYTPPAPEEEWIIPRMREVHKQMDPAVPANATVFLGDSITMALATSAVAANSVNYGIGWQRSDQLLKSMEDYSAIQRASRVVVTIGTNDLLQGREAGIEARYKSILAKIPLSVPVVMNSVPPIGDVTFHGHKVDDAAVREVVATAQNVCKADPRCRFVNTHDVLSTGGKPTPGVLLADQIHLSPAGYQMWIDAMKPAVAALPQALKD